MPRGYRKDGTKMSFPKRTMDTKTADHEVKKTKTPDLSGYPFEVAMMIMVEMARLKGYIRQCVHFGNDMYDGENRYTSRITDVGGVTGILVDVDRNWASDVEADSRRKTLHTQLNNHRQSLSDIQKHLATERRFEFPNKMLLDELEEKETMYSDRIAECESELKVLAESQPLKGDYFEPIGELTGLRVAFNRS